MVEIIKGSKKMTIPSGACEVYASAGWKLASEHTKKQAKSEENRIDPEESKNEPEEPASEEVEEEEEDVIYVDPEELLEKPLEELDYEELKIVAEYKGIETKGMKSSKALREAIRNKK